MMTPQFTNEAFAALGAPDLVYVRPVKAREVLGGQPVEVVKGFSLDPETTLYAVHSADGERLAVVFEEVLAHQAHVRVLRGGVGRVRGGEEPPEVLGDDGVGVREMFERVEHPAGQEP